MSDGMSDGMSELDSLEPNDSLILPVNIGQCDRKDMHQQNVKPLKLPYST